MRNHFVWHCPYCNKTTTIVKETNYSQNVHYYDSNGIDGKLALFTMITVCPDESCGQYSIDSELYKYSRDLNGNINIDYNNLLASWKLKPESCALPQPDYIPEQIRNDYYEASKIRDLSPKASATLARRCLQGMIRDFWKISKSRLVDEINALESLIDPITWKAIDSLRKIGNIGAHMEKNIDQIIDVDKNEAMLLLKLIEDLFNDWYVSKHDKEVRYNKLVEIAEEKK